MDFWNAFASLFSNFGNLTWQMVVMWGIGALLIYLAIAKRWSRACFSPWASEPSSSTCLIGRYHAGRHRRPHLGSV